MKGIMINSVAKTITEVDVGDCADIQTKLDCRCFTVVRMSRNLDLYVDDEGLLKDGYVDEDGTRHNLNGFKLYGYSQLLMGHGLVLGTDESGESVDCSCTVDQVSGVIRFVELDNPADKPQPQMTFVAFGD